jgi:formiminotetrahydrofolate cyclodeaminase
LINTNVNSLWKDKKMLKELTINQFTKELSSDTPVPGGGSASAMIGATAASLVAMVASLTINKKGYEEYWKDMVEIKEKMEEYRVFFLDAMDRDAGSYTKVMNCYKMPKDTDEEKILRIDAIQEALYEAAKVPLEIAVEAVNIFDYAKLVIEKGNKNAVSDGAVATLMARGAVKGALHNVKINAASLKDPKKKEDLYTKAHALETEADTKEIAVMGLIDL